MSWIDSARTRLMHVFRRGDADARMDAEIAFHIEMETEKNLKAGLPAHEARRRAVLAFGGVEGHREEMREGRKLPLLDDLWRDVRFALRGLRGSPGFALLAVVTLGVGIGASVAMFSILNGILLSVLPVEREDEVVVLWTASQEGGADQIPVTQGELSAFRESTHSFSSVAGVAFQGASEFALRDRDRPVIAMGTWATGDLFPVLGVRPVLGRTLLPADDLPGAAPVMVIGHGMWQREFSSDPNVTGRVLEMDGTTYTIVGVLPRGFAFPAGAEFWVPVHSVFPEEARKPVSGYVIWNLVGRLSPGATPEQARDDYAAFLRTGVAERGPAFREMRPVVTPLRDVISGDARGMVWAATAAVGLLLLIACANVASLLLIRGSARARELTVRAALGAGRGRLVAQLLTESAVLAAIGGVLGVALAFGVIRLLSALAPPELPRREMIQVDPTVLLFALAVTAVVALLAGLLPALLSAAGGAGGWLGASRGATAPRSARVLRKGLVISQIALAIVVVMSAGLLLRSLLTLQSVEMGFNEAGLLVVRTALPADVAPDRERQLALRDQAIERIAALPGVLSVTSLSARPFSGESGWLAPFSGDGQSTAEQETNPMASLESAGPEYFSTLQLPLLRGRPFDAHDDADAPPVAIVSEEVARHTWPGEDALGRRIKLGPAEGPGAWHTVVGVVGETRYRDLMEPRPTIYMPTRQFGPMPTTLAVRAPADPAALIPQIRVALRELHPEWAVVGGETVAQLQAAPLARPRFGTFLISAFAAITMLLATIGIYGAVAATVRERSREIAIRLAIGSPLHGVRALVLRQGLVLALTGSVIGFTAALLGMRVLRSYLFGITPTDPITFGAVAMLVLAATALACSLPVRRAARVDPAAVLRAE